MIKSFSDLKYFLKCNSIPQVNILRSTILIAHVLASSILGLSEIKYIRTYYKATFKPVTHWSKSCVCLVSMITFENMNVCNMDTV